MTAADSGGAGVRVDAAAALPGAQRSSDVGRERASAVLEAAVGEGRLTMAEVEERLGLVWTVRYRHELAAITADVVVLAIRGFVTSRRMVRAVGSTVTGRVCMTCARGWCGGPVRRG